ncbi:5'-nucleotidase C-terminal domain-containing protein [Oscillibacter sp. MSJ-31]|uniref:5'-nucleotidase C-terminal domain-containing protein n=1 Tax=Oscillibacter sp. MSJ-31 TaxID=2841526 RepID=UPI001C10EDFA|nr:5'-nucleotidase C-terminal domain-containing protein [Oscillibacter sp. MSJ-31]MBU5458399.1 5'-nucleotidase C-terminal domain-containing protein [Oscillibacter sp. MSJ-31]
MRKFLSLLLTLAMVFSLAVTVNAEEIVVTSAPAATMEGKTVILHTNDVHGAVEGYAYITALKADYEAKGAEVILVDAGDYSQGTTYVSTTKGADAVAMMNAAGYNVATLGNHEFDYGYDQLKENMAKAGFKVLCADVFNADGTTIFDANYTYTTKSGVKVGFFGMETPETQTKANPALIKGLTFATGNAFTKAAADQVAALKDADVVICMAHLGVDAESKPYTSYDLYSAVKGIDFIIDGHSHTVMDKGANGEPIQSTGTAFENIGVIVIDDATKKIESNSLFAVDENTAKDETVAAAAKVIVDRVDAEYGAVFAKSEVELNGAKAPNGNRDGETNNGDLITDAMVWKVLQNKDGLTVDTDHVVAITNGGGIRAPIKVGDITKKDINTVLPFGNTVAVVYVTGAQLLEALEASTYSLPVGGFPQVSGINFTIDTAKEFDVGDLYPGSTYHAPKSINRVTIDSINGKAFKADDTYAVVTNNFCAAGGDTYYAFAAATAQFDTGVPLDEAMMEYITTELKGVVGEQYAAPQGRITVKTAPVVEPEPQPEPQPEPKPEPTPAPSGDTYTVVAGDCLWNIAYKLYGTGTLYTKLAEANKIADPYIIYIGQILTVPAK